MAQIEPIPGAENPYRRRLCEAAMARIDSCHRSAQPRSRPVTQGAFPAEFVPPALQQSRHPAMTVQGQPPTSPSGLLRQLPPAADMPPSRLLCVRHWRNLTRVMNIIGVQGLLAAMGSWRVRPPSVAGGRPRVSVIVTSGGPQPALARSRHCWQPSLLRPMQRNRAPCPRSPHYRPV